MNDILLPEAGTYIISIKVKKSQNIEIGKIGNFAFIRGYYLYVGSAHGPGGIRARINRHLRKDKVTHWHIDYLRSAGAVTAVLINYSKRKKECIWAKRLNSSPLLSTPVERFGSSDCMCLSHLFFSKFDIDIQMLKKILKDSFELIIT